MLRSPPVVTLGRAQDRVRPWLATCLLGIYLLSLGAWIFATRGPRVLQPQVGWLISGTALAMLVCRLSRGSQLFMDRRSIERLILVASASLHVTVLVTHWPLLSDDVVRYRFDGRQWIEGRSAYLTTPARAIAAGNADSIDRLTPHPSTSALYLPTSQGYFAGVALVERSLLAPRATTEEDWRAALHSLTWLERAGVWRAASSSLTLASVALLLRILRRSGRSAWWAAIFAWHPLALIETGGSAHQDVLGIALMLLAIHLSLAGRTSIATVACILAALVKPIALLPSLAAQRLDRRSLPQLAWLIVLLMLGAGLTFLLGGDSLGAALHRYSTTWEFNGGAFEAAKWLCIEQLGFEPDGMKQHLRKAGGAVVLLVALLLWVRKRDPLSLSAWVMSVSCLVSPVLYPWYLLWPLALTATGVPAARWTIITWSVTSVLSYAVLREPEWILPARLLWMEYLPVLLALAVDLRYEMRTSGTVITRHPAGEAATLD